MKHYPLLFLILCCMFGCKHVDRNSFVLSGTVGNAIEGEAIHLFYPIQKDGIWYEKIDTAIVSNGKFRFEGIVCGTTPAILNFDDMSEISLYLEPADVKIRFDRERPYDYTLSGTDVEKEHRKFRGKCAHYEAAIYLQNLELREGNEEWNSAEEKNKDSLRNSFYELLSTYKENVLKIDSLRLDFIREHPDYAIIPDLLLRLSRSQSYDGVFLKNIYDRLPESSKHSVLGQLAGKQIAFYAGNWGHEIGDNAFDFTGIDASGKTIRLSDYKGHYVLLDFWASWCHPCLREIPNVKKLHSEYVKKGLQIIGISCDDNRESWLGAIEKYELTAYPQLLAVEPNDNNDEPFFSEQNDIADIYGVTSIPQFILIDKQGKIIARWSHIEEQQTMYINRLLH